MNTDIKLDSICRDVDKLIKKTQNFNSFITFTPPKPISHTSQTFKKLTCPKLIFDKKQHTMTEGITSCTSNFLQRHSAPTKPPSIPTKSPSPKQAKPATNFINFILTPTKKDIKESVAKQSETLPQSTVSQLMDYTRYSETVKKNILRINESISKKDTELKPLEECLSKLEQEKSVLSKENQFLKNKLAELQNLSKGKMSEINDEIIVKSNCIVNMQENLQTISKNLDIEYKEFCDNIIKKNELAELDLKNKTMELEKSNQQKQQAANSLTNQLSFLEQRSEKDLNTMIQKFANIENSVYHQKDIMRIQKET